jgi:hypothetical protein
VPEKAIVQANNIVVLCSTLKPLSFGPRSARAEQEQWNIGAKADASGGAKK